MNRRNIIVLAAAALFGLVAVFIVNTWFSGVEEQQERLAAETPLAKVVVASQPMEFGAPLTQENIRLVDWPSRSVPPGAFNNTESVLNGTRVALRPILVGEPILAERVSGTDGRAAISANIPEDMRAMTIRVNEITGVGGFVVPGDVVDVILTRQMQGEGATSADVVNAVILESVQVLAIDQRSNEKDTSPKVVNAATVLVSPYDAQKLILAARLGSLSLTLRNIEDQTTGATTMVTGREIAGSGFYVPARNNPQPAAASGGTGSTGSVAAPAYRGPTMTVVRGVDGTDYRVKRYGRR
ncbi:Flp pilus assembly protein CpaB [Altererythrobacter sp. MF3-039]|uniref:Flp pilus assembly protein CpaB n=1 Tax=Altererythrobacter sp. MF3-039 TaxID=3252901 RepID=UPI00390C56A0